MGDGLIAAVVVVVVLVVLGIGVASMAGRRVRDPGDRMSSAAAEVDALFSPARRHVAEHHHVQEMRRDDPGDGDRPWLLDRE